MDREEVLRKIRQAKQQRLTELDLSNDWNASNKDKLTEIPAEVFELEWLKVLKLNYSQLTSLPEAIGNLHNLSSLELGSNQLTSLPKAIGNLHNLSSLELGSNQLTSLPEAIGNLHNLSSLELGSNQLISIPEAIGNLHNLSSLDLRSNQLISLPEAIGNLHNLSSLDLWGNRLTSLPEAIGNLHNLSSLELHCNQLTSLPKAIGNLQNLFSLKLGSNQLTSLPEAIGDLQNLSSLDLRSNQLISLPESIGNLHNLSSLELHYNQLTSIPEAIGNLHNLSSLYLDDNQLTSLPKAISNLHNLSFLYLDNNPLETPPIEVVKQGINAIKKYFIQLKAEGEDYLYEAKLLIVGEGGAGKTSLAKKIEDLKYTVPNLEKSTEGIDIVEWHFETEKGQDFRTNIWDFGGQEIYNATHRFFLTKRSLYILVADERKENTLFDYWLNIVELLSDNSPLLIIKNERDDRKREINITQLKGRFDNIKDEFATNLATNRGLDDIIKAIKYYITSLTHIGSALPKTWTRVRETLEKDPRNYISLEEYLIICESNGFKKQEDKLQVSQFLHDIGVILHFQDNK